MSSSQLTLTPSFFRGAGIPLTRYYIVTILYLGGMNPPFTSDMLVFTRGNLMELLISRWTFPDVSPVGPGLIQLAPPNTNGRASSESLRGLVVKFIASEIFRDGARKDQKRRNFCVVDVGTSNLS